MIKSVTITVTGRVQGVGFRQNSFVEANRLGIKGFIKNERDGSVYIEAESDENILNQFVEWCKKSPGWSKVNKVIVSESWMKNFDEFEIRY